MGRFGLQRLGERDAFYVFVFRTQELIRPSLDPPRCFRASRPSLRRVVFEPAVLGRIVRGSNDNSVCECRFFIFIVNQNRARDDRRRRETIVRLDNGFDAIYREHFENGSLRRSGQRVRILAQVKWTSDFPASAIIADRLRNRKDVRLIKRSAKR